MTEIDRLRGCVQALEEESARDDEMFSVLALLLDDLVLDGASALDQFAIDRPDIMERMRIAHRDVQ